MNYALIELCIDTIERNHNKVYTNYKELSELIRIEMKEVISEEEILDYYENYYCCLESKIQANVLGINY